MRVDHPGSDQLSQEGSQINRIADKTHAITIITLIILNKCRQINSHASTVTFPQHQACRTVLYIICYSANIYLFLWAPQKKQQFII